MDVRAKIDHIIELIRLFGLERLPAEYCRHLDANWRKDPACQKAHAELAEEFALVAELIRARMTAGLTQAEVAERMQSTQPAIARLEAGGRAPSTQTLQRYAKATGHRLRIRLELADSRS
jgi:ribosome-binding protein aMBF1 (putative translation factor)